MAVNEINTASAVIGLSRKLEEDGAKFYSLLAEKYPQNAGLFSGLAKENRRFVTQIEQTYYSVISDALEGCFSFRLNPEDYQFNVELGPREELPAALTRAIEMEGRTVKFYLQAAEQSKSLLADVPRVFSQVAQKRESRKLTLEGLGKN
jgi:rubrerythrin